MPFLPQRTSVPVLPLLEHNYHYYVLPMLSRESSMPKVVESSPLMMKCYKCLSGVDVVVDENMQETAANCPDLANS